VVPAEVPVFEYLCLSCSHWRSFRSDLLSLLLPASTAAQSVGSDNPKLLSCESCSSDEDTGVSIGGVCCALVVGAGATAEASKAWKCWAAKAAHRLLLPLLLRMLSLLL